MHKLLVNNFQSRIESAKITVAMIEESTAGKIGHFYNFQGGRIREFWKPIKFSTARHPLIIKYGRR